MDIVEFKEYISNLASYLEVNEKTVVVVADKTYCLQGTYSALNEEYCNRNGVEILRTRHFGGTIINFEEDVCIGNFQKIHNSWGKAFIDYFVRYLGNRGLNAILQDNDVLVDGFKCGSYMTTSIGGTLYSAIHISVGMDLELIKNICTKPMHKIPRGLCSYGITKVDVLDVISSFEKEKL